MNSKLTVAAVVGGSLLLALPACGANDNRYEKSQNYDHKVVRKKSDRSDNRRYDRGDDRKSVDRDRSYTRERSYDRKRYDRKKQVAPVRKDTTRKIVVPTVNPSTRVIVRPKHRVYKPWPRPKVTYLPYRRPGYVIRKVPPAAITVTFGSFIYFFYDGLFYEHQPFGYVVVAPPIGAVVPILPIGYVTLLFGGRHYYYYESVYYVWDVRYAGYRVIDAPPRIEDEGKLLVDAAYEPGDVVDKLPNGAKAITVNGVQYYRYEGIYFLQSVQNGEVVYIVVNLEL